MMNSSSNDSPNTTQKPAPVAIRITADDRWFFCGKTGSGKSFLIKHLARLYAGRGGRVVVIDGPDQGWLGKDKQGKAIQPVKKGPGTIDLPRLVTNFNPELKVQMFRPKVPGYNDTLLHAFLRQVFKAENSLVIFDELFGIIDPNHQPEIVMQLWSQGRKHNIACWAASQRPARIPEIVMSQAENWAVFKVVNTDDRKKIADWTASPQIRDAVLPPRYWWYLGPGMDTAQLMRPIKGK